MRASRLRLIDRKKASRSRSAGALQALAMILLAAIPVASPEAQGPPGGPRRALVLYSYSRHLPWGRRVMDGVDEAIAAMPPEARPVLFEENLDASRVDDHADPDLLARHLAEKYRGISLDAVITESQQAAAFLLARPELFPGSVRYILHFADTSSLGPGTGSERRFSSASDLERALRTVPAVWPAARRVVVVSDRSASGAARIEQLRDLEPRLAGLRVEVWADYTLDELLARAAGLPGDSAILYLAVQRDRAGRPLVPSAVAAKLVASSTVPVFSHFDSLLGTGILGGYMVSGSRLGHLIADIAARGDGAIPVSQAAYAESMMGFYFDARALDRWKIPAGRLPAGSAILYREPGFLERHWGILLTAAMLLVVETALVAALAYLSGQRRKAYAALEAERASLEGKVMERTADLSAVNAKLYREIEERRAAEERERAAATEKTTLLKELQHRIKNSLGIIVSLIGLEAGKADSANVKDTLETLESRVAALSALYDILYDTGGIGNIPLADYLERIVAAASESLGGDARGIVVERDIAPVSMDMKRAVSLGLVVNELVTDSLKHAFPGGRKGRVSVRLTADEASYHLAVQDDGIGLPPGFDPETAAGFGFKLIGLLAGQLGAEFRSEAGDGASFALRVPA